MADKKDNRPQFFRDVHELAMAHDVIAYVLVGAIHRDGSISIASGAGSRLDDEAEATPRIYLMIQKSFEQAMVSIAEPEPATNQMVPKGTLVN